MARTLGNVISMQSQLRELIFNSYSGLALAPWDVLASGKLRSNAEEARRKETGEKGRTIFTSDWERTAEEKKVCDVLEEIAAELGLGDNVQAGTYYL